jgi:hypothetical protein
LKSISPEIIETQRVERMMEATKNVTPVPAISVIRPVELGIGG